AEHPLACSPIAVSVHPAANQGDDRLTIQVVPAQAEALGELAHPFAAAKDCLAATCSCHRSELLGSIPSVQFSPPRCLTYLRAILLPVTNGLRSWDLRLAVLGLFRCFLPAWARFSLPEAVTRKRF